MILKDSLHFSSLMGAMAILGFQFSYVFKAPGIVLLVSLMIYMMVGAIVHNVNQNYIFWGPLFLALGSTAGGFLSTILSAPSMFSFNAVLKHPLRIWRLLVICAVVVGIGLWWILVDRTPWFWIVPSISISLLILASFVLFQYHQIFDISITASFELHFWWLLFSLAIILPIGILESFVTAHYVKLFVGATLVVVLTVLHIMNLYLPSEVRIDYVPNEYVGVMTHIGKASTFRDLTQISSSGNEGQATLQYE